MSFVTVTRDGADRECRRNLISSRTNGDSDSGGRRRSRFGADFFFESSGDIVMVFVRTL